MPRALRIQYPGAIYHVINRGDRREPIFRDDVDRRRFITTLGEVCAKTDWQVHAYVLMPNHFHFVVETPNPNLVAGMKWFLGTYTTRFNHRHKLAGHLFSGRYKALIVDGSGNDYLRTVCDYVHLNPVRADLLCPEQPLVTFGWSSWPAYLKPPEKRPCWLRVDRLLGELGIPKDSAAGRQQLERYLETRQAQEKGVDYDPIRRGWCLGDEQFRRELLARAHTRATEQHHAQPRQETIEDKARRLVTEELDRLGWASPELALRPKGDIGKIRIAQRLRAETAVTLKWIATELHMGTWTNVSNLLAAHRQSEIRNEMELNLVSVRSED
jgi:putative transposase